MRDLYFTSTNPKHTYKSEKFFSLFFRLRKTANFGSRVFFSNYKKFLVLKKFFQWYYFLPTKRFFRKIFSRFFQQKKATFRYLATFFYLLESNLLVVLVRTNFAANMYQALSFVKGGLIAINGFFITRAFSSLALGDIVECLIGFTNSLLLVFWRRYLTFKSYRLRYFQGFGHSSIFYKFRSIRRRYRGRAYPRLKVDQRFKIKIDKRPWFQSQHVAYFSTLVL